MLLEGLGAVYFGPGDPENTSFKIPGSLNQDANTAEVTAALVALRAVHIKDDVVIISQNSFVREAMNTHLGTWENQGWVGVKDRHLLQCLAAELRTRLGRTSFQLVKPDSAERDQCNIAITMARSARSNQSTINITLDAPEELVLSGVHLTGTKQKLFSTKPYGNGRHPK